MDLTEWFEKLPIVGVEPMASCFLGKHSTNYQQTHIYIDIYLYIDIYIYHILEWSSLIVGMSHLPQVLHCFISHQLKIVAS